VTEDFARGQHAGIYGALGDHLVRQHRVPGVEIDSPDLLLWEVLHIAQQVEGILGSADPCALPVLRLQHPGGYLSNRLDSLRVFTADARCLSQFRRRRSEQRAVKGVESFKNANGSGLGYD